MWDESRTQGVLSTAPYCQSKGNYSAFLSAYSKTCTSVGVLPGEIRMSDTSKGSELH